MTTFYKNFRTTLVALSLSIFVMQADVVAQNTNHSFDADITAVSPTSSTSVKHVTEQTPSTVTSTLSWLFDWSNFSSWILGDGQNDEVLPKGPGPGDWEWDDIEGFGG